MRINLENKAVEIEPRDWNFIFPQYIRSYLFYSKNQDPGEIVFPMFPSVPHPFDNSRSIPVRWVPFTSPVVTEIIQDGSNVPEATEEQVAELDKKDEEIKKLKEELKMATLPTAKAQTGRAPRLPDRPIEGPSQLDNMHSRDEKRDIRRTAKDLQPEPDVDESKEVETEIKKLKE